MRVLGVARGNITRRPARSLGLPALCWLLGALGSGCGAAAGGASEGDEGTTESVNALSAGDASGASASAPEGEATAGAEALAPEEASVAVSGGPPVTTPPSDEPLPHAALDTSRSLDRLAPAEVVIEPDGCRFEFLGESVRCENAGWPNVLETDAPDLEACMRQCLERDDCTAVTDYLWMGRPDLGCYLYLSACDEPQFEGWGEEDGGRDFRRSCDDASTG